MQSSNARSSLQRAVNSPLGAIVLNNLSVLASRRADLDRAEELLLSTLDLALQFGDRESVRFTRANLLYHSLRLGRWDELLEEADRFIAECETSPHNMETTARELRGDVRFARGDVEAALADWERGIALAREMESPERVLPALLRLARGLMLLGRRDEARVLVAEGMGIAEANPTIGDFLAIVADQARALGVAEEIVEIIELAPAGPWKDAALTAARGERSRAADMYERMGVLAIAADVRFGAAEALLEDGRTTEGLAELDKALAFFRPVEATFFLERAERLVAEARTA